MVNRNSVMEIVANGRCSLLKKLTLVSVKDWMITVGEGLMMLTLRILSG
jgi:hypothetical protein